MSVPALRSMVSMACCGCVLAWSGAVAQAQPAAPQKLRIVGGLATVNQYTRHEEPFWTKELSRLSAGKFDAGVVPFGTILISSMSAQHPEYSAADLAGLNPDMASLKKTVAAFRPYLEKMLRERHGIKVLALYVYPAQVIFCKKPIAHLSELTGRRVRVSSATQSDFVGALGGVPVLTGFSQIMEQMASGNIECAITGAMSGNTLGLQDVTKYVHTLPITWGMAIFGANMDAWNTLAPELKALLSRELPKLEAAIWAESEQETAQGLACNRGAASCSGARKGHMVEVNVSAQDERRRREIFTATVLARWLQRCNARCSEAWNQTIGPARGIMVPLAK